LWVDLPQGAQLPAGAGPAGAETVFVLWDGSWGWSLADAVGAQMAPSAIAIAAAGVLMSWPVRIVVLRPVLPIAVCGSDRAQRC
jgi:hypothetical protein